MNSEPTRNDSLWQPDRQASRTSEAIVRTIFGAFALVSVLTTIGIVGTLIFEMFEFFQEVPFWNFLTDDQWTPLFPTAEFGIFVLISATARTSTIAVAIALPLGLFAAIFLSEYAGPKTRQIVKPLLEVLAGIPSVVFG